MFTFSKTKLSIFEIWQASFKLYRQTVIKVWYLALLMFVALNFGVLFNAKISPTAITRKAGQAAVPAPFSNLTVSDILIYIIGVILAIFIMAVVLHRIYNLATNPNFNLAASVKFVLSKYLVIFSCMLLVYLAASVGLFLFIVPGIVIGIFFLFSLLFILFDDAGWISAIKKSCQLVWGNWWRTFVIFMVPALIMGLIIIMVQNLIVLVVGAQHLTLNILIAAVLFSIIKPYIDSVLLVQFNDLKLRKS